MQKNVANTMGNLLGGNVSNYKWSIDGLGRKKNKRTKSHSVKKSEIFYCVLNFEMRFRKRKNKRQRLSLPLELLAGLEPATC